MTRTTSFLVDELSARIAEARELVDAVEGSSSFLYTRRLFIYEAAYLLAFSAWENLLEQSFFRFLCGCAAGAGVPARFGSWSRPKTIQTANTLILGGRAHLLWHNPGQVISRSKRYFSLGPHEIVLLSALSDIENFAAIRHYVAHRNADTGIKFQAAATSLTGAPVHGGRAGRLLRATTVDAVTGLKVTWFERITADLERYATQIAA